MSHPESSSSNNREEQWARLRLLKRQLEVAVSEEDYQLAAALRDEVKSQVAALPPVHQYLQQQVQAMRKSASLQEKQQAIKAMVDAGDNVVVPDLATYLGDPDLAELAFEAMWALFMKSPDHDINELMVRGVSLMSSPTTRDVALAIFNDMVHRAPHFAEAYNKRATVLYTMKRFEDSIEDCRTVLRMQPYHFGAASGLGLCYLMLSREQEAAEAFELALTIHPGMSDIARVLAELRRRLARQRRQQGALVEAALDAAAGLQEGPTAPVASPSPPDLPGASEGSRQQQGSGDEDGEDGRGASKEGGAA